MNHRRTGLQNLGGGGGRTSVPQTSAKRARTPRGRAGPGHAPPGNFESQSLFKCHFRAFLGVRFCALNEEKMLGILMKQDQVVGKTKLISGKAGRIYMHKLYIAEDCGGRASQSERRPSTRKTCLTIRRNLYKYLEIL